MSKLPSSEELKYSGKAKNVVRHTSLANSFLADVTEDDVAEANVRAT